MTVKRILIFAPTLMILFLLQSYFWAPTYEEQAKGNPQRLREYISASIGDAHFLNPVLSSDASSSDIESKVFEGLIDRDEKLHFRGRLAHSWDVYEEAFFHVNDTADIPGIGKADADRIAALIRKACRSSSSLALKTSLDNIRKISVLPPREFTETIIKKNQGKDEEKSEVKVHVKAPARIKLILAKVDQDLFKSLTQLLGKDYFKAFDGEQYLSSDPPVDKTKSAAYARKFIPAIEHNPVLIFHLRPNVKFHDGHIFDANDVKFTYASIMNPKSMSPRAASYEPVKAVEVLDLLTLRITYKRLYSPAIGTWSMGILPEHLLSAKALEAEALSLGKNPKTFTIRESTLNRNPVGCGPFKFREWKSDQYIALERFDNYWEGPPNYLRYTYRIIPDLLTQEMEFYAGTIDSYGVQPHQVKRLKNDPTYQCFTGLSFGYSYIGYNLRRKPFDDPNVRKALGMAIDVNKIIKYVLYNQGNRITGPFAEQTDFYNHKIAPLPYDPEQALSLLNKAGWKRNKEGWLEKNGKKFQFTLITNNGNPLREEILAIAQDAWKKIGVDVRTDRLEWSVFIQERVNELDFDAIVLGWSMGIDPDLYELWHSSQTNPHQLNFVGFKNKEADALIIRIRQEYDHEMLVKYCHRLHEIIAAEQPYTFLYAGKWTAILDKRVVIKKIDSNNKVRYEKIKPTKTGNFQFYFNKWIKLSEMPNFDPEG